MKHIYIYLLLPILALSCRSSTSKVGNTHDNFEEDMHESAIQCDTASFGRFKRCMLTTPEGYNKITDSLVRRFVLHDSINLRNVEYLARYLETVRNFFVVKIRKSHNKYLTDIFIVYDSCGFETDYMEILNYCRDCEKWQYNSMNGFYYDLTTYKCIGIESNIYDTIDQGKVLHHDLILPKQWKLWEIDENGNFKIKEDKEL